MPGAVEEFVVELAGGVHAAAAARRVVTDRGPDLAEPLRGDVLLLVTELVTNAVRHGRVGRDGSVRLECRSEGERVKFLVTDAGTSLLGNGGPPVARPGTNGDDMSGWGLLLVEEIAEQWGVLAAPPGTCVWFEVAA
jgi:anti-sigma regulatory factor (Ser/Thr protein kinase)